MYRITLYAITCMLVRLLFMYPHTHVCMYVCTYVCMHVRMYVCTYVQM